MKKVLKVISAVVLVLVAVLVIGLIAMTVLEYRPAAEEAVPVSAAGNAAESLKSGDSFKIVTWNIGYGALGDNADFFMDGGSMVNTANEERVRKNLSGIAASIDAIGPDVLFLQETDRGSARSHNIDELNILNDSVAKVFSGAETFACNFKVAFIPYPIPPIGWVNSGIVTASVYPIQEAARVQLPCPFSWPVRTVNLKRCLLVSRVPLEGSDKELVLVNLHLEAYDDGEGKVAQTRQLAELMKIERDAGNFVIAGGDFNQTFSTVDASAYPKLEGMWECGAIDAGEFADGFTFVMDNAVPSCRSLDRPLAGAEQTDPEHFQYYLIDGFIVSDNLTVESFEALDMGFENTDHNPVVMTVTLNDR